MATEDFPTPGAPEEGSDFDSRHASKSSGSLKEAKQKIGQLWDFIAQFEQREITDVDFKRYFILAQEIGPGESTSALEWRIREVGGNASIYAGTISGLSLSLDTADNLTLGEWREFSTSGSREIVYLEFVFTPEVEFRNYNDTTDAWAIDDGGTVSTVTIKLEVAVSAPDPILPTVDPVTGATTDGTFYVPIGFIGGDLPVVQSNLGPINIQFCAPSSFTGSSPWAP